MPSNALCDTTVFVKARNYTFLLELLYTFQLKVSFCPKKQLLSLSSDFLEEIIDIDHSERPNGA